VEAQIPVPPVQRPQLRGLRIPQPGDREPCPLRPRVRPPLRATLDDRDMPIRDVGLNPHLVAHPLRNPVPTPTPQPRGIDLQQPRHAPSLNPSCCDVDWNPADNAGAKSLDETHSIGSIGDAYDNALMESINGLYKAECIRTTVFGDGPYRTIADVEYATSGWSIGTTTVGSTAPSVWSLPPSSSKPITRLSAESRNPYRTGTEPRALQTPPSPTTQEPAEHPGSEADAQPCPPTSKTASPPRKRLQPHHIGGSRLSRGSGLRYGSCRLISSLMSRRLPAASSRDECWQRWAESVGVLPSPAPVAPFQPAPTATPAESDAR